MVTTVAAQLFGQHLVSGAGLAITGGSAVVYGLMAMSLITPVGLIVGGTTLLAGEATLMFAGAELQEHFTGSNYMKDDWGIMACIPD